jgi:hypothetical protein
MFVSDVLWLMKTSRNGMTWFLKTIGQQSYKWGCQVANRVPLVKEGGKKNQRLWSLDNASNDGRSRWPGVLLLPGWLMWCKLDLAQIVRFFMVESTHLCSNSRFNMCAIYLWLIILLVIGDVHIDNETLFDRLRKSQGQTDSIFRRCL